ncbi:MAG: CDP-glycerol glycerophosphotransferase family protein [Paludibacteraceae bacterium]|nr:CDP-glycerol glycerophosphotransferase family protein [Paludibacteraceae bacterium]
MTIFNKIKDSAGISILDAIYKAIIFHDTLIAAFPRLQMCKVKAIRKKQEQIITSFSNKKQYNVLFFLQSPAVWKYDTLYRLMESSSIFKPTVVISPYNVHVIYDKNEYFNVMHQAEEFAKKMGYNYLSAYDYKHNKWLDVKNILHPNIVFFAKPYKDTLPKYHLYNYTDCLTLYAPYGITCIDIFRTNYNLPFNNILWRFLVETDFHKHFSEQYSLCKGDNTIVVGALGEEKLMLPSYQPQDIWKQQEKKKKRIIWAPHHTVDYLFNFSNFLVYCDEMFRIANKYKDHIQIAFKPHPVLKFKLINLWGKEKTEAYYQQWAELDNGQIAEGDYMDLFLTSDAMIHDCASFTAEYLYTQKPVLFMVRDENVEKHWNRFGKKCFEQHYHATNINQIEHFIEDVVINGNDTMKEQREQFFKDYLYPKDGVMPSQKIYNLLTETLGK